MSTTTRTEYRAESRSPVEDFYGYRQFTGSRSGDRAAIHERMRQAEQESPGWTFRIVAREVTVTTTMTRWRTVQPWLLEAP